MICERVVFGCVYKGCQTVMVFFVSHFSYEKMISGKYLGEIARQALQSLVKSGKLFGGKSTEKFDKFEAFETKFVSTVEEG